MTQDLSYLVHRLDGPDGAHWQTDAGPTDLSKTVAIPTIYIGWKAVQSLKYVDPSFVSIRAQVRKVSFLYACYYGWLSSTTDPIAQAQHYIDTVGPLLHNEGAMIDAEEAGITVETVLAWLEHVEEHYQRPCEVYTGIYVAGGSIWTDPRIRMSKFGPRGMHVAAYVSAENLCARLKALGIDNLPVHGWQWSSSQTIPGISGRVDVNAIYDRSVYNRICGVANTEPVQPHRPPYVPTPLPLPEEDMSNAMFIAPQPAPGSTTPVEYDAAFFGVTNSKGAALKVWWSGAGGAALDELIDAHRNAGMAVLPVGIDGFKHAWLEGPLPTGDNHHTWTGSEFFNRL